MEPMVEPIKAEMAVCQGLTSVLTTMAFPVVVEVVAPMETPT